MHTLILENLSDSEQRLDKFIKKYLKNLPLWGIYKMLRTGKIKVNWKKKDASYILRESDEVKFFLTEEEIQELRGSSEKEPLKEHISGNIHPLKILFEDEVLLIVSKESGENVHPGDHKTKETSLIERVQDALWNQYDSLTFKPSLVHRIDRETSGCVLIAKEKQTLEKLLEELQSHRIEKIYHAIVLGVPRVKTGTVRARLKRIENARNEAKVQVSEDGQSAVTHYEVLSEFTLGTDMCSLVECRIETGRTHQIRVHMKHIGHPILGDKAYGEKRINSFLEREYNIRGQLLHARSLTFIHPRTTKEIKVIAPYDERFGKIVTKK